MFSNKLLLLQLCLYLFLGISFAQSSDKICDKWTRQLDTVKSLEEKKRLLKQFLPKTVECKTKLYAFLGMTYYESRRDLDSCLYYFDKAIAFGEKEKQENHLLDVLTSKAYVLIQDQRVEEAVAVLTKSRKLLHGKSNEVAWENYHNSYAEIAARTGDLDQALKHIDSILLIANKSTDTNFIATSYHNRGTYKYDMGDYEGAAEDLLQSVAYKESMDNPKDLDMTYSFLGNCYITWKRPEVAEKYLLKSALESKKTNNQYNLFWTYNGLSDLYAKLDENEKAFQMIDTSLALARDMKNKGMESQVLIRKAKMYHYHTKDDQKAEQFYLEALEKPGEFGNNRYKNIALSSLMDFYVQRGYLEKAKSRLGDIHQLIEETKSTMGLQELHRMLWIYYERIDDKEKALKHLKEHMFLKDSISTSQVKIKVADLEKKYQTKKNELQIVTLNQEKQEQIQIAQKAENRQLLLSIASLLLIGVVIIITRLLIKLRRQQKELKATNQVKNRLFSIIAHDLRGMIIPFQRAGKVINHYVDKDEYGKVKDLTNELQKNSDGLSGMLDNLLNWSLTQMNGYVKNEEEISFAEELNELLKYYQKHADLKNNKLVLKYDQDIKAWFDKGAFHVIFRNLISNALKYTENGTVRIKLAMGDDLVACSISDTGVGMSQEKLETVLSNSSQNSETGTQGEKGTGIGLDLAKRFIELHGGTITVSSELRVGTHFKVQFPVKKIKASKVTSLQSA